MVLVPNDLVASGPSHDLVGVTTLGRSGANGSDDPGAEADATDLLAAEAGTRPGRPILRPVPDPQGTGEPRATTEPGSTTAPAPLPRRGRGRGAEDRASEIEPARVGAGPGREGLPRRRKQANLAHACGTASPPSPRRWHSAARTKHAA